MPGDVLRDEVQRLGVDLELFDVYGRQVHLHGDGADDVGFGGDLLLDQVLGERLVLLIGGGKNILAVLLRDDPVLDEDSGELLVELAHGL